VDPVNAAIQGKRTWEALSLSRENLLPFLYKLHYSMQLPDVGGIEVGQNGRATPFRFSRNGEKIEIKTEHRVGVNESNAHLAAGIAGLGIIQTFAYAARPALKDGALVEILRRWRPPPYPFHVVYPQNRHMTHRLVFSIWPTWTKLKLHILP
jgi:DNA-binding transcriptional LysR family regulator